MGGTRPKIQNGTPGRDMSFVGIRLTNSRRTRRQPGENCASMAGRHSRVGGQHYGDLSWMCAAREHSSSWMGMAKKCKIGGAFSVHLHDRTASRKRVERNSFIASPSFRGASRGLWPSILCPGGAMCYGVAGTSQRRGKDCNTAVMQSLYLANF